MFGEWLTCLNLNVKEEFKIEGADECAGPWFSSLIAIPLAVIMVLMKCGLVIELQNPLLLFKSKE